MATTTAETEEVAEGKGKKKSKKKLFIIIGVVVLLGGGYTMMGSKKPAKPVPGAPVPAGPILTLDPITLNLADSHYLQVGIALQLAKGQTTDKLTPDTAKALDTAIGLLGNRTSTALAAAGGRDQAKSDLSAAMAKVFPGKVIGIYFTSFVIQ